MRTETPHLKTSSLVDLPRTALPSEDVLLIPGAAHRAATILENFKTYGSP